MSTAPTSPPAESEADLLTTNLDPNDPEALVAALGRALNDKEASSVRRWAKDGIRVDVVKLAGQPTVMPVGYVERVKNRPRGATPGEILDFMRTCSGGLEPMIKKRRLPDGRTSVMVAPAPIPPARRWLTVQPPTGLATRPRERHGTGNTRTRGSRRTSSRSAGGGSSSDDDGESEPSPGRRPRHISEVTRPLLRGWIDRFNRTAASASLEPHERLGLFLALPSDEQADHFAQLGERERLERILDGDLDWPEPVIRHGPSRIPSRRDAMRHASGRGDVLDTISAHDYWPALTGAEVPASGRVRCPAPGHEDVHPSVVVYAEPGRGWWCPVCGAGGTAIDLAALLTGISPRREGYWRLREWVAERLLNAPIRRSA